MKKPVLNEYRDPDAWIEAIAARAKTTPDEARAVLDKHRIEPKPSIAIPKRISLLSLSFKGQKRGAGESVIGFDKPLSPGFWALTSQRNSRGKTSLLNIIRWCLTGHRSVDPIMDKWFDTVQLVFDFDGHKYEAQVHDAITVRGMLLRHDGDRHAQVGAFETPAEFEGVMSAFFMTELGLQGIVNNIVRDGKNINQPHGWPWLSTAMSIDPNPSVLFGTQSIGAMPARMMQMFLGVPWVNTINDIRAAEGRLKNEERQSSAAATRTMLAFEARVAELQNQLSALRAELEALPHESDLREAMAAGNRAFVEAEQKSRKLLAMRREAADDQDAAQQAYSEAKRALQIFKDSRSAGIVFRNIRPVSCPSCDEVFSPQRESEKAQAHRCVVCDTPEIDGDDSEGRESELEAASDAAKSVFDSRKGRFHEIEKEIAAASSAMRDAESACERTRIGLLTPSPRNEIETSIIRLEAQIRELARSTTVTGSTDGNEEAILDAAGKVTEDSFKPAQEAVLKDVSDLIFRYAKAFGVENLEAAELNGAAHLKLTIAGQTVNFGSRSSGERARLKIATTLALIKVADGAGVGRHPGLLLVDSPAGSEMVTPDYEKVINGFAALADEVKHMQIFMAAIHHPLITERVPCSKIVNAKGEAFLW